MQQGSAGLVEVLPWVGPAWVSAGAQTLSLPSRLEGAYVTLLGAVSSSCFAVSVGPEQFKPLPCYLNPSSLATASSLCRGVCMCYRFQLITSVGILSAGGVRERPALRPSCASPNLPEVVVGPSIWLCCPCSAYPPQWTFLHSTARAWAFIFSWCEWSTWPSRLNDFGQVRLPFEVWFLY